MVWLGIDPGKSGGIAFISGDEVVAVPMPETEADILEVLGWYPGVPKFAVLEFVRSTPQMGVTSAFTFGRGYGALRMGLLAAKIPFEEVTPPKWQRELGLIRGGKNLGKGDTSQKNALKAKAQELYPGIKVTHAVADALLIVTYAQRTYGKR